MPSSSNPIIQAQDKVAQRVAKRLVGSVPVELIEDTLHETDGNIYWSSKILDVRYLDLCDFIDKNYKLQHLVLSYRRSLTDDAERVLREHLANNNLKAAIFALTTLGKDRGYVPKTESHQVIEQQTKIDLTKLSLKELRTMEKLVKAAEASEMKDITPK